MMPTYPTKWQCHLCHSAPHLCAVTNACTNEVNGVCCGHQMCNQCKKDEDIPAPRPTAGGRWGGIAQPGRSGNSGKEKEVAATSKADDHKGNKASSKDAKPPTPESKNVSLATLAHNPFHREGKMWLLPMIIDKNELSAE